MTTPTDARIEAAALGKQIAKILDEEGVRPPLKIQVWDRIHKEIEAALAAADRVSASDYKTGFDAGYEECLRKYDRVSAIEETRRCTCAIGGYCRDHQQQCEYPPEKIDRVSAGKVEGWHAPYLIWWTSQSDCERIERLTINWPMYLASEFQSRVGRAGRGRLWVPTKFEDDEAMPREAIFKDDNPVCGIASDAGGIVFPSSDYLYLCSLPGFITNFEMQIVPAPPPASDGG